LIMGRQTSSSILMIEPVSFRYNEQTATNNYFQQEPGISSTIIQEHALQEFNEMVDLIRSAGITVVVIRDNNKPPTPDSIFPNNWISFHEGGTSIVYPMYAENRRNERRTDILDILGINGFHYTNTIDLSTYEKKHQYLEGTGSMVFDRCNNIAYAALSARTHPELFSFFCKKMGFKGVSFTANQQAGNMRRAVYHTNVMMCLGEQYAIVCLDSIDDIKERQQLISQLKATEKAIIEISEEQMCNFAGNMLQVRSNEGVLKLILSEASFKSLTNQQRNQLATYNELIICAVPTIEKYGGGSVRCMIAELF
jgi:hypothetical protein